MNAHTNFMADTMDSRIELKLSELQQKYDAVSNSDTHDPSNARFPHNPNLPEMKRMNLRKRQEIVIEGHSAFPLLKAIKRGQFARKQRLNGNPEIKAIKGQFNPLHDALHKLEQARNEVMNSIHNMGYFEGNLRNEILHSCSEMAGASRTLSGVLHTVGNTKAAA